MNKECYNYNYYMKHRVQNANLTAIQSTKISANEISSVSMISDAEMLRSTVMWFETCHTN